MTGRVYYSSPVGELLVESEDDKITTLGFLKDQKLETASTPVLEQCVSELDEYFLRGRKFFSVELNLVGTSFQVRVWTELLTIPFGKTISYLTLAKRLGDPDRVRAVGLANGQNPVAIIVPCHRVIGQHGDLVGYAGGLDKKEWLLSHEGAVLQQLKLF